MSVMHKIQTKNNQELFLENLTGTQEWLEENGIDHRLIGSVATSAYIDPPGQTSLDFNREGAFTPDQKVPDIDLIVPRDRLDEVRNYRDSQKNVKLGLAFPSRFIDFRPDENESYLTYRKSKIPVASKSFRPVIRKLIGVPVTTVSPNSLLNIHKMLGTVRDKDENYVQQLELLTEGEPTEEEDLYFGFKEFSSLYTTHHSPLDYSINATKQMLESLPPPIRNRAMRCALVLASLSKLR
jgi:hypothetical protein